MKLYLSSEGFPTRTQFKQLVGKKYGEARVGLIMNAVDWRTIVGRKIRYVETKRQFAKLGIKPTLIDLKKFYDKSPDNLLKTLLEYDFIWVRGGNTFFLRYVMKKSGFDKVVKKALTNGLVYGGSSAGALIMGPTLKYLDKADDPSVAPEIIWKGIGIIDTVPLPHWGGAEYGVVLRKASRSLKADGEDVIRLTDDEALIVEDGSSKKVRANRWWR